jgi:hypothetical protein
MTSVVKEKNELMVPQSVPRPARLKTGDQVEFKISGGIITSFLKFLPPTMNTRPSNAGLSTHAWPKTSPM